MPKTKENCPAGHRMTEENTYWHRKHGNTYPECRQCRRETRKDRKKFQYTKDEQIALSKRPVIQEDISGITECPRCNGRLHIGIGNEIEDALSCIYCGWRPTAKVEL